MTWVHARYMLLCMHARMKSSENWRACLNLHNDHFLFSLPFSNMTPSPIGATESDRPLEIELTLSDSVVMS